MVFGKGFDIKTINQASKITELPIIACGGAGNEDHFYKLLNRYFCTCW